MFSKIQILQSKDKHNYRLLYFVLNCLIFTILTYFASADASCLNLNKVQNPRVLGIASDEFAERESFSFAQIDPAIGTQNPWNALNQSYENRVIPAIADQTVIVWGLNKSVGDTLTYTNAKGEVINLKLIAGLANSIFQGNLLISEQHFLNHFFSNSGYRAFLIDGPLENRSEIINDCLFQFQDMGLELIPTEIRLAEFNQVENTYLSIFTALGALGMMIGSIGLGIVILRNIMERRNEMAILQAVGYGRNELQKMVLSEHWILGANRLDSMLVEERRHIGMVRMR